MYHSVLHNTTGVLAGGVVLGLVMGVLLRHPAPTPPTSPERASSAVDAAACTVTREEKTVRGSSMAPLIPAGARIEAEMGYYTCHTPERGDIVLATYVGNDAPLIKRIHGIPDDTVDFAQTPQGTYHLLINGAVETTSSGTPYAFSRDAIQELAKYMNAYHGTIPRNYYLLLGEQPQGSMDAARFGLLHRFALIGKVMW